jgi:uncharacterized protein YdeI (YjbR/CyaY-like superfamily)
MQNKDLRVDAYIANAAGFARPILRHLRTLVRESCPEGTETIKWGMPSFEYNGLLCGMGAFKRHCTFFIWKAAHLRDPHGILEKKERTAMGQFGQITVLGDLPADKYIKDFIRQAVILNEKEIRAPKKPAPDNKKLLIVPPAFKTALKKNKNALGVFERMSPGHKREYCEWIAEAMREETRQKRIATAIAWIAKGKGRNWKYERKQRS